MTQNAARTWCSNADALHFGNAEVQARVLCLVHVRRGVSVLDFTSRTLRAITLIVSTALFLLLLSGSAKAQSVEDSGVACDIGPNAPAIPAEAQAAGFTHCAANWDFSQPLYATLSNWFDCDGGNPYVLWHSGSAGVSFSPPCNSTSIHQTNDDGPTVVMQFEWLPSYMSGQVGQTNQVGGQTFNNWNSTASFTVGNYYIETVDRLVGPYCQTCAQNSSGPNDVYAWGTTNGGTEVDVQEFYKDTYGFASGNCATGCDPYPQFVWTSWGQNSSHVPSGYSIFDYHKYGALLTSDGATNTYLCMYIDDALQGDNGCVSAQTYNFNARSWLAASAGSNDDNAGEPIDFRVQYIRVWSCDAWQTSMCNGSLLFNDGNGLIYWQ